MTIKTTRWSPDTCNCILEYTWDDSLPNDQITVTPSNIVGKCPAHTSFETTQEVFNVVNEENPRKNKAIQIILDNGPSTLYDIVGTVRVLKPTISVTHTWTGTAPNRVLRLTITGSTLTTAQKNTITAAFNTLFGTGKVVLV